MSAASAVVGLLVFRFNPKGALPCFFSFLLYNVRNFSTSKTTTTTLFPFGKMFFHARPSFTGFNE
jgi:hypothetical protein